MTAYVQGQAGEGIGAINSTRKVVKYAESLRVRGGKQ
jgi:hypothetical protein